MRRRGSNSPSGHRQVPPPWRSLQPPRPACLGTTTGCAPLLVAAIPSRSCPHISDPTAKRTRGGGRYLKYRPPGRRFNYRPPPGRRNSGSPWLAGAPPCRMDCLSVLNPLLAAAMTARRARPWPIGHAAPSSSPLPRHPAGRASFPPPRPEAAARRRRSHAARKQVRRPQHLVHTHAVAGEAGLGVGAARWPRPVV